MRWLLVRELASLAWRGQFLFLAISKPVRFNPRELHDVLRIKDSWSGRVKITHQLRRDLEWWVAIPNHSNGRSIYKPAERACMHVDISSYGWGAVLNETTEARWFWSTYVPLDEDNMGVVHVLANLTSLSPMLMTELRKL
eukprot:jgi/Tetstr1/425589/TSEL_016010.t1